MAKALRAGFQRFIQRLRDSIGYPQDTMAIYLAAHAMGRLCLEWITWVTRVESDDRPAWLQPPLPLS
jgi:hypothetical protein